jgi:chitin synthase
VRDDEGARTALRLVAVTRRERGMLLTNMPGGLVHIIDDQSRRRGKTDTTMLQAMSKRF